MKPLFNVATILSLIVLVITFSGCLQYPDGPFFTLQSRDERIEGTWQLVSASDPFGADITSEFKDITLTVIPSRSGDNSWTVFKDGHLNSQGTYQFASHGDQVIVAFTALDSTKAAIQVFYNIRKLTDKNFNYVDDNSNTLNYDKY